jgi:hypothetical protein
MPDSPDFGDDLHQHPDLHLAPQLQNLSDHFFILVQNPLLSIVPEFSPVVKFSREMLKNIRCMPNITFAIGLF